MEKRSNWNTRFICSTCCNSTIQFLIWINERQPLTNGLCCTSNAFDDPNQPCFVWEIVFLEGDASWVWIAVVQCTEVHGKFSKNGLIPFFFIINLSEMFRFIKLDFLWVLSKWFQNRFDIVASTAINFPKWPRKPSELITGAKNQQPKCVEKTNFPLNYHIVFLHPNSLHILLNTLSNNRLQSTGTNKICFRPGFDWASFLSFRK